MSSDVKRDDRNVYDMDIRRAIYLTSVRLANLSGSHGGHKYVIPDTRLQLVVYDSAVLSREHRARSGGI
jgi:hypothetical protein